MTIHTLYSIFPKDAERLAEEKQKAYKEAMTLINEAREAEEKLNYQQNDEKLKALKGTVIKRARLGEQEESIFACHGNKYEGIIQPLPKETPEELIARTHEILNALPKSHRGLTKQLFTLASADKPGYFTLIGDMPIFDTAYNTHDYEEITAENGISLAIPPNTQPT